MQASRLNRLTSVCCGELSVNSWQQDAGCTPHMALVRRESLMPNIQRESEVTVSGQEACSQQAVGKQAAGNSIGFSGGGVMQDMTICLLSRRRIRGPDPSAVFHRCHCPKNVHLKFR